MIITLYGKDIDHSIKITLVRFNDNMFEIINGSKGVYQAVAGWPVVLIKFLIYCESACAACHDFPRAICATSLSNVPLDFIFMRPHRPLYAFINNNTAA